MSEKAAVWGCGRGKDWESCSGKKKHSCCPTSTASTNIRASLLAAEQNWLLGATVCGWSYQGLATEVAKDPDPGACTAPGVRAPHSQVLANLPKPLRQRKISKIQITSAALLSQSQGKLVVIEGHT